MTPPPIEDYMKLGPVGAALATSEAGRPRVLLIDELDKSDIDLPNDLLHVFEEGEFPIPELQRLTDRDRVELTEPGDAGSTRRVAIDQGVVRCREFPIVVMTSNDERDFPPAAAAWNWTSSPRARGTSPRSSRPISGSTRTPGCGHAWRRSSRVF